MIAWICLLWVTCGECFLPLSTRLHLQAYETLGDERKRQEYDRYGATPLGGGDAGMRGQSHRGRGAGGGMSFAHANDIFRAFFGGRVGHPITPALPGGTAASTVPFARCLLHTHSLPPAQSPASPPPPLQAHPFTRPLSSVGGRTLSRGSLMTSSETRSLGPAGGTETEIGTETGAGVVTGLGGAVD